ncbi:hypothetical protein D3C85_1006690 [compost metagenome]
MQIVHSATLEVVLLSVSSFWPTLSAFFMDARKLTSHKAKHKPCHSRSSPDLQSLCAFSTSGRSYGATLRQPHHAERRLSASRLMRAAINLLKLLLKMPLQNVKQNEGCSEVQHLRNCGFDVRSNRGPARWYRPVQAVHLNGGILTVLTQAEPAVSCSSGEIFYGHVYQYQHFIIERPA